MATEDNQLSLETDNGQIVLPGSTLLVGLDETGHEELVDPGYPIFGLGGCAVRVCDYPRLVRMPWCYMKKQFFGIMDKPLHAAALHHPTAEQLDALGHFFRNFQFSRLAALATGHTLFGERVDCLSIVGRTLLERLKDIIKWYPDVTKVALVFEHSQRATAAIVRSVSGYEINRREADGSIGHITIEKFAMAKSSAEPCLEVADFVMHAAGTQTRERLEGAKKRTRKDFRAVFRDVDKRLVSFREVTKITKIEDNT